MCQYLMTINWYRQAKLGLTAIKCSYRHTAKEKAFSSSYGASNSRDTSMCSLIKQDLILQEMEELTGKCSCKHSAWVCQDYSNCFGWDSCHLTASTEKSNLQSKLPKLPQMAVKCCTQRCGDSSSPEAACVSSWILHWDVFSNHWPKKSTKPCVCTVCIQKRKSRNHLLIILWKHTYYERVWGVSFAIYPGSPVREKMHHAQTFLTSTNIFIDLANCTLSIITSMKLTNEVELQIGSEFSWVFL